MLDFEIKYFKENIKIIAGLDEAGRGPLCGPVVACVVLIDDKFKHVGINDSKALSEKKRNEYYEYILENALEVQIEIIEPIEIDKLNIYQASKKAMERALAKLNKIPDLVLTDCMPLIYKDKEVISLIKGDKLALSIAAASIIAKVTRDKIMEQYDEKYPEYGFKNHKGYCTKAHLEAITKYGIIKGFYRESYRPVKEILDADLKLF